MTQISRNVALAFLGIVAVSMGTTYAVMPAFQAETIANSSTMGIVGHVTAVVHDAEGNIVGYRQADNEVVNGGITDIVGQVFTDLTDATAQYDFIEAGIGGVAAGATDTDVTTLVGGCARVAGAFSDGGASAGQTTITATATFSGASCEGEAIVEAGIFNAASAGTMLARNTFTSVTLGSGDSLSLTWTLTFG